MMMTFCEVVVDDVQDDDPYIDDELCDPYLDDELCDPYFLTTNFVIHNLTTSL